MYAQLRPALVLTAVLTLLTGLLYPLVITGAAQLFFPTQANGSLLVENGTARGSALIGQSFDDPRYFWGRLSATSPVPYTPFNADKDAGSTGSNYGPLNPKLTEAAQVRIAALRAVDPGNPAPIPVDLVTSSGSGLDPDISPAAAEFQVERVARVRGLSVDTVRTLVQQQTQPRQLRVLGEPRVNVLELNLALDRLGATPERRK
jgi:potassium-transporting ATPase KdpC subunit